MALGGDQLSEKWTIAMLLSSLPRSYDTLVTALETRREEDLTLDLVQQKLVEEYKRQQNPADGENTATILRTSTANLNQKGNGMKCYFCKKQGHMKKDCRKYQVWKANQDKVQKASKVISRENEFCFNTTANDIKGWVIDSGATCHISSKADEFVELDNIFQQTVVVANGEEVKAIAKGTCKIEFLNSDNEEFTARVEDVLYVPSIQGNLLSVKKLVDKGLSVLFNKGKCQIYKEDKEIAVADHVSNLYKLRQKEMHKALAVAHHSKNCQHFWHRLFGHREINAIKTASSESFVNEIKMVDCGIKETCTVCVEGKMSRLPFPKKSEIKSKAILDLVVSDVCGPMQTTTPGGNKYFLTFIDDYSRFTVVYLIKEKSQVPGKIKEYVEMVKTKFSRKPKVIRSDNGTEYINKDVIDYFRREGIISQHTAPYTPQQNGIAERKNRSLVEMARCLLIDANLGNKYWGEAIMTANYLQNRLPSSVITLTPYEHWEGRKPNIDHLQLFGSKVYVHIPKEKRKKFDKKAELKIFVGYDEHAKGYRLLDVSTNKVIVSRDVKFVESMSSAAKEKENGIEKHENISTEKLENIEIEFQLNMNKENKNAKDDPPCTMHETSDTSNAQEEFVGFDNSSFMSADAESFVEEENEEPNVRKSARINKGIPPKRYSLKVTSEISEPRSIKEALNTEWKIAMQEEINSLKENNTWVLEELPPGRKAIGCKWVFKLKKDSKGNTQRYKARLVAQGYSQKYGLDYDQVFAPVVKQSTFRTLLAVAGHQNMIVKHFDAKTAFLNGELKETIYMKQPPGFEQSDPNMVCRLQKTLYGLKQSARVWNQAVHDVLINGGYVQAKADPCLYHESVNGISVFILIYVDDLIVASKDKNLIVEAENILKKNFEVNDLGEISHYLGLEVKRDKDGRFSINQTAYINKLLVTYGLEHSKSSTFPLDPGYDKQQHMKNALVDNKVYQQLIGSLLYISVNTRPDIAAAVSTLARKVSNPNKVDWNEAKRILKYLKGTADLNLKLGNGDNRILYGFADANWAENRADRKSNSGYVLFVYGGAVSWACRKQNCVALSSTEAEFVALSEACQEASFMRRLLADLNIPINEATVIWEDNQSCLKLIQEEKLSNRTKHIDTRVHFVKDYVCKGIVRCEYLPTSDMVADMLTKPLGGTKIKEHRMKCGLVGADVEGDL